MINVTRSTNLILVQFSVVEFNLKHTIAKYNFPVNGKKITALTTVYEFRWWKDTNRLPAHTNRHTQTHTSKRVPIGF